MTDTTDNIQDGKAERTVLVTGAAGGIAEQCVCHRHGDGDAYDNKTPAGLSPHLHRLSADAVL